MEKTLIPMQVMIDAILINQKWGLEGRVVLCENGRLEAVSQNVDMYKTSPRQVIAFVTGEHFTIKLEHIDGYDFQIDPKILLK